MKSKRITVMILTFVSGLVIGCVLIGMFWFTSGCSAAGGLATPEPISLPAAKALYQSYLAGKPFMVNGALKSFMVDKQQYEAMKMIADKDPNITGFRLYFGKDTKGDYIVVIGVGNNGEVYSSTTMFSTIVGKGSPCPPICDQNSQMN